MCRDHLETGLFGGCGLRPGDAGWYVGGELHVGFERSGVGRYGGQQICQVHCKRYEDLLFPGPHVPRVEECLCVPAQHVNSSPAMGDSTRKPRLDLCFLS